MTTHFPEPDKNRRALRVQFPGTLRAVIRLEDGRRTSGRLRLISLTGGLLRLSEPLIPGTLIEVFFMSQTGPILGIAELLGPPSATLRCLQPFKFVMIEDADHQRLKRLIGLSKA
jgi:hypothetical protein